MAGIVYVGEAKSDKPGNMVDENAHVEVRGHDIRYVSRGGLKLEKAMQVFPLTPEGKVCMDIGASTGGFTDCMLQNGAVEGICCGRGLRTACMDAALRQTCCEYGTHQHPPCDSGTATGASRFFQRGCFLYFSASHIFPVAAAITAPEAEGVCLVKPQFEAGKEKVGKKGVVREAATHREVIEAASGFAVQNGFSAVGLDFSPIKGPEGNIEFLMHVRKCVQPEGLPQRTIEAVVSKAHESL